MLGQISCLIASLVEDAFDILLVQVGDDIVGFLFGDLISKKLRILILHFQPRGVRKYGAHRSFQQNIINTYFILFRLNRLTYTLKIDHLLKFLLEDRSGWKVE